MTAFQNLTDRERKLIEIAGTWGRVAEREGYGDGGFPVEGGYTGFHRGPGIVEKSALFQRLLAGKAPLAYRPPTSHSYPWYEVIEGEAIEHRVFVGEAPSLGSMMRPGANEGEGCIVINGALWRLIETIRESEEYIVGWGQYPMRWRLVLERCQDGTVAEKLRDHEAHVRRYCLEKPQSQAAIAARIRRALHGEQSELADSREPLSPEEAEQALRESLRQFEADLRDPKHPNLEIDANDVCWELRWMLRRIGLSGWPFAGTVCKLEQRPLTCLLSDDAGPVVLFEGSEEDQSEDTGGTAWLRIERDPGTGVSRYVSGMVSARSKLDAAIASDLAGLTRRAATEFKDIWVMDRQDADGTILGLYHTTPKKMAPASEAEIELR